MSLFLSSGEASGDHYTANLARMLRASGYSGDLWGMGGLESRDSGIRVEWHGECLQLFGLTEVFSSIPSIVRLRSEMVERIMDLNPEGVIVADSPDYHMHLIARLRKRGYSGKVFYISPPAVWAWRSSRVNDLRKNVDECLPLFSFEHDYLKKHGCLSYWRGHPLLEEFPAEAGSSDNIPEYLTKDDRIVAFLPGSRGSEVNNLLPVMEKAAYELAKRGWHPVFSIAPGLNPRVRSMLIERFSNNGLNYYEGPGRDLMAAAKCAIGASGTISVESFLLGCYMIVTYKLNPISALVARCIVKTRYFAMANILVGSEMFPELMQWHATPENIIRHAVKWLDSSEEERATVREQMSLARRMLGEPGVYRYWAERIMEAVS